MTAWLPAVRCSASTAASGQGAPTGAVPIAAEPSAGPAAIGPWATARAGAAWGAGSGAACRSASTARAYSAVDRVSPCPLVECQQLGAVGARRREVELGPLGRRLRAAASDVPLDAEVTQPRRAGERAQRAATSAGSSSSASPSALVRAPGSARRARRSCGGA